MTSIRQAKPDTDQALIEELFQEYLEWTNRRCAEEYAFTFDVKSLLEQSMAMLEAFRPPCGRLLLAIEGRRAAGIACMRGIREDIGEVKRMYVRPEFRQRGIGRALLQALMAEAREIGYLTLRLDSTRFMAAAHALYRSAGFQEIGPYAGSEIPPELRHYWVFMEKQLQGCQGVAG